MKKNRIQAKDNHKLPEGFMNMFPLKCSCLQVQMNIFAVSGFSSGTPMPVLGFHMCFLALGSGVSAQTETPISCVVSVKTFEKSVVI